MLSVGPTGTCICLVRSRFEPRICSHAGETPIHVTSWGFLGETWPFFRPNFNNMEAQRQAFGAQQVGGGMLYCRRLHLQDVMH